MRAASGLGSSGGRGLGWSCRGISLWSLGFWLRDRGLGSLARMAEWRPVYGLLKLVLEVTLPLARWAGRGEEVVRVGIEHTTPHPALSPEGRGV